MQHDEQTEGEYNPDWQCTGCGEEIDRGVLCDDCAEDLDGVNDDAAELRRDIILERQELEDFEGAGYHDFDCGGDD